VLRAGNRVDGKKLPPNRVLVKLRDPDNSPTWVLDRDAYDREKYFRVVHNCFSLSVGSSSKK
jgi:hypothetical protein